MVDISKITLVTGAARSGTSLCAGAIHLCGAFGGLMRGKNPANQRGMFENARIVNTITKPYLRDLGLDPLGQYPLPDMDNLSIPLDWRKRVEQVFKDEGYQSGPLFYKGAKMTLTWPIWHYHFPAAKWIIVRRRSGDIADSCCRTSFMRAFIRGDIQKAVGVDNERDGWLWWVNKHLDAFRGMLDAGLNCQVIWPERWVSGDYQQLYSLIDWLGLEWNPAILEFVDPQLWKARSGKLFSTPPQTATVKPKRKSYDPTKSALRKPPPPTWWKKDQRAEMLASEKAADICIVCGQYGWWSQEDRSYRCNEHRGEQPCHA